MHGRFLVDVNFILNTKRTAAKLPFLAGCASVFAMPEDRLPACGAEAPIPLLKTGTAGPANRALDIPSPRQSTVQKGSRTSGPGGGHHTGFK